MRSDRAVRAMRWGVGGFGRQWRHVQTHVSTCLPTLATTGDIWETCLHLSPTFLHSSERDRRSRLVWAGIKFGALELG